LLRALRSLGTRGCAVVLGVPRGFRPPQSASGFERVHRAQTRVLEGARR